MFYEKSLLKAGVPVGDIDACMVWAFGNDWRVALRLSLKDPWNNLHKDLLVVTPEDEVYEFLIKVGLLYLEHEGKMSLDPELVSTEQLINILEARMDAEIIFIKGSAKARKRRT